MSGATKCEMSNVEGVNSTSSMFANTLQQITRSQVLGFAYNEAMPVESSNATKAHAKGFVLVDVQSETGIWMPHSVPKFDLGTEYAYPETGTKYGQHFACFSLDQTALKELGEHLSSTNVQSFGLIHSEYLNQVNSISEKLRKVADLTSVAILRTPPASGSFKTRGNFQVTLTRKVHTDIRNQGYKVFKV
ncbi:hypothetical protein B566_EDAN018721 [Ephemera danica]|nr:hypothetical protein B566_EDAN018721 [Ephemera danica]